MDIQPVSIKNEDEVSTNAYSTYVQIKKVGESILAVQAVDESMESVDTEIIPTKYYSFGAGKHVGLGEYTTGMIIPVYQPISINDDEVCTDADSSNVQFKRVGESILAVQALDTTDESVVKTEVIHGQFERL